MIYDFPISTDDVGFERAVLQAPLPVVAVFWSPSDSPRQELSGVLEQTAQHYAGDALVVRLAVTDVPQARAQFKVDTSPQFLFFRAGKLIARVRGVPSVAALRPWVDFLLGRGPKPATRPREQDKPVGGDQPVTVSDADFDQVVLADDGLVVVDCWAAWCGPCRTLAPVIEGLAREFSGRALVAKLDVDANPVMAQRYGVQSIPTLLFFRNGQMIDRVVGVQPAQVLKGRLEGYL